MTEILQAELIEQIKSTTDTKLLTKLKRVFVDDETETKAAIKRQRQHAEHTRKKAKQQAAEDRKLKPIQAKLDKSPFQIEAMPFGYRLHFNYPCEEDHKDDEESEEDEILNFSTWVDENVARIVDGDVAQVDINSEMDPDALVAKIETCRNPICLELLKR